MIRLPNQRSRPKRLAFNCLLAILVAGCGTFAHGQQILEQPVVEQSVVDTAKEYKVKAVYLYSFGRFTRWLAPTNLQLAAPFTIGVVGSSPVIDSLSRVARKRTIRQKKILIKTYADAADVPIDECQIVFVTRGVSATDTVGLVERLRDSSAITVTESMARHPGTVVNFILEAGSIHFELNIEEAQRKKLSMDARLLRQGRRMLPSSPPATP